MCHCLKHRIWIFKHSKLFNIQTAWTSLRSGIQQLTSFGVFFFSWIKTVQATRFSLTSISKWEKARGKSLESEFSLPFYCTCACTFVCSEAVQWPFNDSPFHNVQKWLQITKNGIEEQTSKPINHLPNFTNHSLITSLTGVHYLSSRVCSKYLEHNRQPLRCYLSFTNKRLKR